MSLISAISNLHGKKRAIAAFALGVFATLALPPFFALPLLAVSVSGWYLLLTNAETPKRAFFIGWWWGLGFFMSGLYWMVEALLVDAEKFAWMIPFCLFGLNGIIALYPALTSLLWRRITEGGAATKPLAHMLLFVGLWSISEYLRGILFTGFPWNLIGYAWAVWPPAIQSASIFGIQGLTLLTMLLAVSPVAFIYKRHAYLIGLWGLFACLLVWGYMRIPSQIALAHKVDQSPIQVRFVQAAIPQTLKWVAEEKMKNIKAHFTLSEVEAEKKPNIIIWPESSIPLALNNEPYLMQDLTMLVPPGGEIITGAIHVEHDDGLKNGLAYYNSIFTINEDGIGDIYDKHHLVPFGEFMPYRQYLPLDKISPGDADYSRGPGPKEMILEHRLPAFSPLVCYEAIFPENIYRELGSNVKWIVNVTNDGWFGTSIGPHQHFHMTRFRAVEYGLPLARAANSGISAMIDPYGQVTASLGLGKKGVLDTPLPASIKPTWFSLFHNKTYFCLLFLVLFCAFTLHYLKVDKD